MTVQLVPAARVDAPAGQVPPAAARANWSAFGPPSARLVMFRVAVPVLLTVTVLAALVVPTV